jgi:hypothetical protein
MVGAHPLGLGFSMVTGGTRQSCRVRVVSYRRHERCYSAVTQGNLLNMDLTQRTNALSNMTTRIRLRCSPTLLD